MLSIMIVTISVIVMTALVFGYEYSRSLQKAKRHEEQIETLRSIMTIQAKELLELIKVINDCPQESLSINATYLEASMLLCEGYKLRDETNDNILPVAKCCGNNIVLCAKKRDTEFYIKKYGDQTFQVFLHQKKAYEPT